MKAIFKKLLRRGITVCAALTVCALGIRTAVRRSAANAPDAVTASAKAEPPVIVLDAGHGEST